jgi:hypothetical protein
MGRHRQSGNGRRRHRRSRWEQRRPYRCGSRRARRIWSRRGAHRRCRCRWRRLRRTSWRRGSSRERDARPRRFWRWGRVRNRGRGRSCRRHRMEWNQRRLVGRRRLRRTRRRVNRARHPLCRTGGAWRRKFFVDRSSRGNGYDTAANRTTRPNSRRRHLRRIDAKYRLALRTRDVHFTSVVDGALRDSEPASSGGDGASVRRSIEYTDPGNVFA